MWNGGVKHIYEVTRRLKRKCEIQIYVGAVSPYIKNYFAEAGIEIKEVPNLYFSSDFSLVNLKHWLFFDYYIRSAAKDLESELADCDALISSYFPMNCITKNFEKKSICLFFEPCTFLYGDFYLTGLPFMRRTAVKFLRQFFIKCDKEAMRKQNKLITNTIFTLKAGNILYGKRAGVIYPGVDQNLFRRKYDDKLAKQYFGYKIILHSASYYNPSKGTDFLIRALPGVIKEVPKTKLLITTCSADIAGRMKLVKLTDELGVSRNVEFLHLDEEMLPFYYSLANVIVQPSIDESFSLPLSEGNACETPVIAFESGGSAEQIADGVNGFTVPLRRTDKLASTIVAILKNPDLERKMGRAGRRIIKQLFTWDQTSEGVWAVIKSL